MNLEQPKQKMTLWVVTQNGEILQHLTGKTSNDAYIHLGRWLITTSLASMDSWLLKELGVQACRDANPFRVQKIEIEL